MNVSDILQDDFTDKIYSSILFTLVNLPYRDNSIDLEDIIVGGQTLKCYQNHYRFKNGQMVIIKIASAGLVPYGIYARKIINFLIAEFTYKKNYPSMYTTEMSRRMVNLGKKPLDFVQKICGTRNPGTRKKIILTQLEAILNCNMAIATGYKQINPKDDEILASEKYQFALIESNDEQLVNHKFDVFNNWQEEIYISRDLADRLSRYIMPLDNNVYSKISSPMELDMYQYFAYQSYYASKNGITEARYNWDDLANLFGRGYAKNSMGLANFRHDFRKNLEELQSKVNLGISAPSDTKYITFAPVISLIENNNPDDFNSLDDSKPYQSLLKEFSDNDRELLASQDGWQLFLKKYDLFGKFDNNAIKVIKEHYFKDAVYTEKTIKYVLLQNVRNTSAYAKTALDKKWIKKYEEFMQRFEKWKSAFLSLSEAESNKYKRCADEAYTLLRQRYAPEDFSEEILTLIYTSYFKLLDFEAFLKELDGSKYKTLFQRHFDELIQLAY